MNRHLSKFTSMALAAIMLVGTSPISAFAATKASAPDDVVSSVQNPDSATPDSAVSRAPVGLLLKANSNDLPSYPGEDGIYTENGKTYYFLNGALAKGWQNIGDDWYYFDENYEGINGRRVFGGIEYSFNNGLAEGVWKNDGKGTRYYYGPSYYRYSPGTQLGNYIWKNINGNTYAFDANGYRYEGYALLIASSVPKLYEFTSEGVLVGEYSPGNDYTGLFTCQKTTTYLKNGVPVAAGLVRIGGDYYYVNSSCELVSGNYEVTRTNGLLLPGFYQFAKDGKMIDPPVYEDGPNKDGSFYRNGVRLLAYQLVAFGGKHYYISDYNKYARNITLFLDSATVKGTSVTPGYYYFNANGEMTVKDGPDADGYFYLNTKIITGYQIISFNGDYYFINDGNKYARNVRIYIGSKYTNGTGLLPDYYNFGDDGKLISLNGPREDGYFYRNNVKVKAYTLEEYDGSYYFINDANKYAVNMTLYMSAKFIDKYGLPVGYYYFDQTGKMVLKEGLDEDGSIYIRNVKQRAYQLLNYNGDYYFIDSGHKYAKNTTLYMSARFVEPHGLPVGYYNFGADGKLIFKNGPDPDGYFYRNGLKQSAYKLEEYEGNYYFINDYNKLAKNVTLYMSAKFIDQYGLPVGYYYFDNTGKMVLKDGPNEDGCFYIRDIKQRAYQLLKYNGDYYFIDTGHKYAKNTRLYMSAGFIDQYGLPVGYYDFDETGKMIIRNGPDADGYFYQNNIMLKAYQLVEYNGDYYFIDSGNKYAADRTVYLTAKFTDEFGLAPGYYAFDQAGRAIMKNGPEPDGSFYINGVRQQAYRFVKYNGDYYFIGDGNKIVKNRRIYCPDQYIEGTDFRRWDYWFDADGKLAGYYEGVPNGRDIGDIYFMKTSDGRDIKSGLLIRGGELDNANYYFPDRIVEIGIDRIENEFNVKFDLDLRVFSATGRDLFGSEVTHKTYNMVLYDQVLTDKGKAAVKEVFTDLADPDNYPVYLHCTHGIDRTGIVCMLLEMALGVPYQAVFDEYLMSVGAHDGSFLKVWNSISGNYSGETEKDKVIAYLKDCGITQEQIDSLYNIYLG